MRKAGPGLRSNLERKRPSELIRACVRRGFRAKDDRDSVCGRLLRAGLCRTERMDRTGSEFGEAVKHGLHVGRGGGLELFGRQAASAT